MPATTWRTSVPMSTMSFKSFVALGIASAETTSPTRMSTLAKFSMEILFSALGLGTGGWRLGAWVWGLGTGEWGLGAGPGGFPYSMARVLFASFGLPRWKSAAV